MAYIRNGYLHDGASMAAAIPWDDGHVLVVEPEECVSLQVYSPANTHVGRVEIYGRLNGSLRPWTSLRVVRVAPDLLNQIYTFQLAALREIAVAYTWFGGAGVLSVDAAIKGGGRA